MRPLQLLEPDDIIYPCDFIRPLVRSADYSSHSDAWCETSTYGGGLVDHLKWSWVWLKLGECWWGSTWGDYDKFTLNNPWPYEAVRGALPREHVLSWHRWQHRHPLFHAFYQKKKEEVDVMTLGFGKFADYPISKIRRYEPSYLKWMLANESGGNPTVKLLRWLDKYRDGEVYSRSAEKFVRMNTARPVTFSTSLE